MGIWDTVLGMVTGLMGDQMTEADQQAQEDQQKRLQSHQALMQAGLGDYNQQLAMKTWRETNYSAQLEEMRKAGLNPGLMYKSAGAGGTTLGNQAGNSVQGGIAAPGQKLQAMGMGIDVAMQQAQIKNLEANTEKTKVETAKTAGVDTARTTAETEQTAAKTALIEIERQLAELNRQVKSETVRTEIEKLNKEKEKLEAEVRRENTEADVAANTASARSQTPGIMNVKAQAETTRTQAETTTAQAEAANAPLRIRLENKERELTNEFLTHKIITQAAITVETERKIGKIAEEIVRMQEQTKQGWKGLNQHQQQIILDKIRTEFGTDAEANARAWIGTITGGMGSGGGGAAQVIKVIH